MTDSSAGSAEVVGQEDFTAEGTAETLERACRVVGLESHGARLLRLGSNAVYRLAKRSAIVRISRKGHAGEARRAVNVARWLESVEFPAVRALEFDQPIEVDGYNATFWEALSEDGDDYASVREVAEVLAKLHSLVEPASLDLPTLEPFRNAEKRIGASSWLSPADRSFLHSRLDQLSSEFAALDFSLPRGVIHGDANVGNVLRDKRGTPTLIDLDGFSVGPREWDLALTAVYYDSFGWHARQEYEVFVGVYGFDIMKWSGYPTMRETREFLMVTWLSQKATESTRTMAEARKRISALRTGASRRDWQPY